MATALANTIGIIPLVQPSTNESNTVDAKDAAIEGATVDAVVDAAVDIAVDRDLDLTLFDNYLIAMEAQEAVPPTMEAVDASIGIPTAVNTLSSVCAFADFKPVFNNCGGAININFNFFK